MPPCPSDKTQRAASPSLVRQPSVFYDDQCVFYRSVKVPLSSQARSPRHPSSISRQAVA